MEIDGNIFLTVLLALLTVEFFKTAIAQILMDRRHRQVMEALESDGFQDFIKNVGAEERIRTVRDENN